MAKITRARQTDSDEKVTLPSTQGMFGSHLSIAGGLVNALNEAERLKMDCVQVFTKNQRQWKVSPLTDEARDEWLTKLKALKWHKKSGPARVRYVTETV